jgi:hypothetical protein
MLRKMVGKTRQKLIKGIKMPNSHTAVIDQAILLLEGLNNNEYQKLIKPYFTSSIGTHMRHIIDHFLALQEGVIDGHVNYNVRHRHNQAEQCTSVAIKALREIKVWLSALEHRAFKTQVLVTTEIDISDTQSKTCSSTIERELVFVSSHAIHHYALIRIICTMQNITIPELFGYAPATISHRNRSA